MSRHMLVTFILQAKAAIIGWMLCAAVYGHLSFTQGLIILTFIIGLAALAYSVQKSILNGD